MALNDTFLIVSFFSESIPKSWHHYRLFPSSGHRDLVKSKEWSFPIQNEPEKQWHRLTYCHRARHYITEDRRSGFAFIIGMIIHITGVLRFLIQDWHLTGTWSNAFFVPQRFRSKTLGRVREGKKGYRGDLRFNGV